jgi:hypothetical protein
VVADRSTFLHARMELNTFVTTAQRCHRRLLDLAPSPHKIFFVESSRSDLTIVDNRIQDAEYVIVRDHPLDRSKLPSPFSPSSLLLVLYDPFSPTLTWGHCEMLRLSSMSELFKTTFTTAIESPTLLLFRGTVVPQWPASTCIGLKVPDRHIASGRG